ncbi:hypothetical protein [Thermodesulfatator indicus]|nr:hypothetical protein [Thermodesulfatator indicus]
MFIDRKTKGYLIIAIFLVVIFLVFNFTNLWKYYVDFIYKNIFQFLGFNKLHPYVGISLLIILIYGPCLILGFVIGKIFQYYITSPLFKYKEHLEALIQSYKNLKDALLVIEDLQKDIKGKLEEYEKIKKEIETAKELANQNRKKLKDMIDYISGSRWQKFIAYFISYILGILSAMTYDYLKNIIQHLYK